MVLSLFGRKIKDDQLEALKSIYGAALERFSAEAITKAFKRVEQECERLPVPKVMREFCAEAMNNHELSREARESCGQCLGTGWQLIANPSGGEWCVKCTCRRRHG